MAKKTKTGGKPKAQLEEEGLTEKNPFEPTLTEFIQGMHGSADTPQDGLPTLPWLKETFDTKSAMVRYLVNQGFEVKVIAKHLGMRYQHVRNVANAPLKRGPNEDWRKPLIEGTSIPDPKQFKPVND